MTSKSPPDTSIFAALPDGIYALDVVGSQGSGAVVTLNGEKLLSGSVDAMGVPVTLRRSNTLVVRQSGKPASEVTVTIRKLVYADLVTVVSPTTLAGGTTIALYDSRITNSTGVPRSSVGLQGWITQDPSTIRDASFQLVSCGGTPGDVPVGSCHQPPPSRLYIGSDTPGAGILVPGAAMAVVLLTEQRGADRVVLDSIALPIDLVPLSVTSLGLQSTHVELAMTGDKFAVMATVATNPPLSLPVDALSLTWTWPDPGVFSGQPIDPYLPQLAPTFEVTAVRRGAGLLTMVASFDPSRTFTTLVSVGVTPSFGNQLVASPGSLVSGTGIEDTLVAQVLVPGSGQVTWSSTDQTVATVNSSGHVITVAPGGATIVVRSVDVSTAVAFVPVRVYTLQLSATATELMASAASSHPFDPEVAAVHFFDPGIGYPSPPLLLGTVTTPTVTDTPGTREFRWTLAVAPPGTNVFAVAVDRWGRRVAWTGSGAPPPPIP